MTLVERAILQVTDNSSPALNKITQALNNLNKAANQLATKPMNIRVNAGNLTSVENRLAALQQRLANMRGTINVTGNFPRVPTNYGGPAGPGGPGRSSYYSNGYFGRFPENIPSVAARYAAWKTMQYGHDMARVGGQGILEGSSERTAQEMQGLTADQIALIRKESSRLGTEYRGVSAAGLAELGRAAIPNLANATDAVAVMEEMARSAAVLGVVYRSGEKGIEASRQAYRGADMAGRAADPARLKEWLDQTTSATVVAGRDINPMMLAQAVANLGWVKGSISGDAIGDLAMLMDEARGRTADYMRTYTTDLMRGNLHKDNKAAMEAAGLRKEGGGAVQAELLGRDPFEHVMKEVKPRLEKMGAYDIINGKRELNVARGMEALQKLGFLQSSSRYALWALEKEEEIKRGRTKRKAVNISSEFVKGLADTDVRSSIDAVQQKAKDAADKITSVSILGMGSVQGLFTGGMGWLSSGLSSASQNPSITAGVIAAGIAGAIAVGKRMSDHPEASALGAAAALHLRAAAALSAAAVALSGGRLAPGLVGATAAQKNQIGAKAAALGFGGTAAAQALSGARPGVLGVLGRPLQDFKTPGLWGLLSKVGVVLGISQMLDGVRNMSAGQYGTGMLGFGLGAAGLFGRGMLGFAGVAGGLAMAIDSAFNNGRVTTALVGAIDNLFGVAKAKANAEAGKISNLDRNIGLASANLATRRDEENAIRAKIAELGEHKGTEVDKERKRLEGELDAAIKRRVTAEAEMTGANEAVLVAQARNLSELQSDGNNPGTASDIIKKILGGIDINTANQISPEAQPKIDDAIDKAIEEGLKKSGALGAYREFVDPKAPKPLNMVDPSGGYDPNGTFTGIGPGADAGATISDAGAMAAMQIGDAGTSAGAAISDGGANAGSFIESAGSSFAAMVSEAGAAFAAMISGLSLSVPGASDGPSRPQNSGGNPGMVR